MNIEETDYMRGYQQALREIASKEERGTPRRIRNATNSMLCWNCDSSDVALVPWPDYERKSDKYDMTSLACYADCNSASFEKRKMIVFLEFAHLVVRDGVCPFALHNVLLELDEYRDGLADDMLKMFRTK